MPEDVTATAGALCAAGGPLGGGGPLAGGPLGGGFAAGFAAGASLAAMLVLALGGGELPTTLLLLALRSGRPGGGVQERSVSDCLFFGCFFGSCVVSESCVL